MLSWFEAMIDLVEKAPSSLNFVIVKSFELFDMVDHNADKIFGYIKGILLDGILP